MSKDPRASEHEGSPFQCVAVVGPGLLGGSVALGVRERLPGTSQRIWGRREAVRDELQALGFGSQEVTDDLGEIAGEADLVILSTPVGIMPDLARRLVAAGLGRRPVVVTDVGSVKREVESSVGSVIRAAGIPFVGSHPMAGSEKTGLAHAKPDLLEGARCIVTRDGGTEEEKAREGIIAFWESLGARVAVMSARQHDETVARISHLPHAAASAVALACLESDPSLGEFSGGGLRDTTRVAAGAPEMWAEILLENDEAVGAALADLQVNLSDLLALLENRDKEGLVSYLGRAKALREQL